MSKSSENWKHANSIYDFMAKDIKGEEVSLEKYKGHVCIIVNVASRCGHTKNEEGQPVERFPSATKPLMLVETLEKYWVKSR
ncbi:hypothetical protein Trydic_g16294 [Trypoxylus dichotomus]